MAAFPEHCRVLHHLESACTKYSSCLHVQSSYSRLITSRNVTFSQCITTARKQHPVISKCQQPISKQHYILIASSSLEPLKVATVNKTQWHHRKKKKKGLTNTMARTASTFFQFSGFWRNQVNHLPPQVSFPQHLWQCSQCHHGRTSHWPWWTDWSLAEPS